MYEFEILDSKLPLSKKKTQNFRPRIFRTSLYSTEYVLRHAVSLTMRHSLIKVRKFWSCLHHGPLSVSFLFHVWFRYIYFIQGVKKIFRLTYMLTRIESLDISNNQMNVTKIKESVTVRGNDEL